MILLDHRIGSGELKPYFKAFDIQIELTELEFGDCCFEGNGPNGGVLIGVERKRVNDLVSSMRNKRLSGHQLPGLLSTYQYVYLVVEGITRIGDGGQLQVPCRMGKKFVWHDINLGSRSVLYREVDHYLSTLTHICGITVHFTGRERDTAAWIASKYHWWNDKEWHQHSSHMEVYAPVQEDRSSRWQRRTPTFGEKIASQLPGVSKSAFDIAKHFHNAREMANASIGEWENVKVSVKAKGGTKKQRLGKVRAERIYNAWRGK